MFPLHSLSLPLSVIPFLTLRTSASGFNGPFDGIERANQKLPLAAISCRKVHMVRVFSVGSQYPDLWPARAPYMPGAPSAHLLAPSEQALLGGPVSTSPYFLGEGSWTGPLESSQCPQIMLWGAVVSALQDNIHSVLGFHCLTRKNSVAHSAHRH